MGSMRIGGRAAATALVAGAALASLGVVAATVPGSAAVAARPIAVQAGVEAAPSPSPARGETPPAWAAFEHAWSDIAAYRATITVFEQQGPRTETYVFDYAFRKPSNVTLRLIKGPGTGVGATVVWNGGDTVVAHRGSGLMAMMTKTLPLHDPLLTTMRGASIDQLSFAAILAHVHDTAGTISEEPGAAVDGIPVQRVAIRPATPAAEDGMTREVVDVSTQTNVPVRILEYDGTTLARQIDFAGFTLQRS